MQRPYTLSMVFVTLCLPAVLVGCTPAKSKFASSSDPAAQLVARKCSLCHTLDRVEQAQKDRAAWQQTVDRMAQNGMVATEQERAAIVDYLSAR